MTLHYVSMFCYKSTYEPLNDSRIIGSKVFRLSNSMLCFGQKSLFTAADYYVCCCRFGTVQKDIIFSVGCLSCSFAVIYFFNPAGHRTNSDVDHNVVGITFTM